MGSKMPAGAAREVGRTRSRRVALHERQSQCDSWVGSPVWSLSGARLHGSGRNSRNAARARKYSVYSCTHGARSVRRVTDAKDADDAAPLRLLRCRGRGGRDMRKAGTEWVGRCCNCAWRASKRHPGTGPAVAHPCGRCDSEGQGCRSPIGTRPSAWHRGCRNHFDEGSPSFGCARYNCRAVCGQRACDRLLHERYQH
jgi:hypothetical protein